MVKFCTQVHCALLDYKSMWTVVLIETIAIHLYCEKLTFEVKFSRPIT